ncbi:MAG: hypothetical protein U1D30_25880 [Planctomycetota bacterium]
MTRVFTLLAHGLIAALFVQSPASSFAAATSADGTESTFQKGLEAFDAAKTPADFLKSASLFQEVLDSGTVNGAVLYNQGNAFVRAGEYGRAIASYRQAQRYLPRDNRLAANLEFAKEKAGLPHAEPSTWNRLCFWHGWLGYHEAFLAMGSFGTLAFALGIVPVIWPTRRFLERLALVSLTACLILGIAATTMWLDYDHWTHGVITAEEVTARKGNGESYQPAFKLPLTQGTEFTLVERRGDWLLVHLADGNDGWVKESATTLY